MPTAHRSEREEEDLVHLYLVDIGRHELLTKDDEARLGETIRLGAAARAELEENGIPYDEGAQGTVVQLWINDPCGRTIELQQAR